ncbi:hypothetical protein TEA_001366 [Camellia sinensis var. sinensis]|uniref:Putative gamma-glutamylcyclotransferase n=1 Tax=Camellia sinensis var. sinensis TaxID=542762 RepID=A0A4S4DE84_CAMSN|nr:hypothetical protein TEA_001366 [Camellia sinensis var. sinensis]
MGSTSMATSSNPQGLHQVFVYGSLLSDEVVRVLLKRVPHHIFSIKECVYPAIIPVENKKVTGKVLLGITLPELDILDTFEDVEYNRCTVEVSLMDGSQKLQAHTYVWANSSDPNLYGDWSFEIFVYDFLPYYYKEWRQAHIKDYIKMTMGFMEELEQPESKP